MTSAPPGGGTWTEVAVTAGAVVVGIGIAFLIPPLREAIIDSVRGDTAAVRAHLRELGAWGVLLVAALAMVHVVIWYPAEILDAAAGFVYGFWLALPMIMVFWVVSGLLAYYVGAHAGRPVIHRFAGAERFERLESAVHGGGATLLLAIRLIPIIPFSLFSMAAGAARVPLWRFTWTTLLGYLPITAIFVYLGSQLETLSPTDPLLWLSALVLIAMLLGIRRLRPRLERGSPSPEESG